MSLDITVHHFAVDSSPISQTYLLDSAQRLVDAATSSTSGWRSVVPPLPSDPAFGTASTSSHVCFVWGKAPPVIEFRSHGEPELLDWDSPFDDESEIINLTLLPEFEQTDFTEALMHPDLRPSKRGLPSTRHFADDVDVNSDRYPNKRLCSASPILSSMSISKLIPFPHYHESPDPARPAPPGIAKIPEFPIARAILPSASFMTLFERMAWLVPLRGCPPVEGTSPAQLYNIIPPQQFPPDGTSPRAIQWTSIAISQFWTFLLRLRETNNFGPIALAYLFSSPPRWRRRETRGKTSTNKPENAKVRQTKKYNSGEEERDEAEATWEYIKIYHDSQYAMKLRSLLDCFRWEDSERERPAGKKPSLHYRVLKATRLVLVDETGDAVLVA
ncbi:hypothetical protein K439DRAFT_1665589 [Ramaria rubella]|nr:hypothetical protein K439DRAFT_1665589 [Ramaria rubella]